MKYSLPRGNGESRFWPPLESLCGLVEANRRLLDSYRLTVLGVAASDFRRLCLGELTRTADDFASEIARPYPSVAARPVIATGHQPEFPHAGVWLKNHLACRLARAAGGASLNLVVDNDVPKHLGLVLPDARERPARASAVRRIVPLAEWQKDMAFEEYPPGIAGVDAFRGEVERIAAGTPFEAAAGELAGRVAAASGTGRSIADVFTAVRLAYEREAGVANAELPVSRLAGTSVFGAFVLSLAAGARRFASAHNAALADYRRENRVRYPANPLPDLAIGGTLVEAPFWVWRRGGARERLFMREMEGAVGLHAAGKPVAEFRPSGIEDAAAFWKGLVASGVKIRPRALSTTLFMRLFASDLFIHGIGGAKYDEVTDRIIRSFYGVEPPAYAVASASLAIDWPVGPADPREISRLTRRLRDIEYNPDRLLSDSASANDKSLIAEKRRLVASSPTDRDARRRNWERIREINAALASRLSALGSDAKARRDAAQEREAADAVLFDREYPFFIVGAERTAEFYREILSPLATSC